MLPELSIIIPALNEGEHIGQVLATIKKLTAGKSYELVVIDNGSIDDTRDIVRQHDVRLLELENSPVAAVRNFGVQHTKGKAVAFIDADVLITPSWANALSTILTTLEDNPDQVLGARCHAPEKGLLNRYWFNRLPEYAASYINSGNLLTSRLLFKSINGFDEQLITSEDYDFCQRAARAGAKVTEIPELKTIHLGYPASVAGFINRERWHGRQDFNTFKSLLESKVAWMASANLCSFILCMVMSLIMLDARWLLAYGFFLICLSAALTAHRFGISNPLQFFGTSLVYSLYIWGRSLAGVDRLNKDNHSRLCSPL